jgi:hypothetical protein
MDVVLLVFAALPVIGGVAMLAAAVVLRRREAAARQGSASVVATVVDNRATPSTGGREVFTPVVEFRTAANKKVRAVGGAVASTSFPKGTKIPVFYDPKDPQRILTGRSETQKYVVGGVILIVLGSGALAVAVWALSSITGTL